MTSLILNLNLSRVQLGSNLRSPPCWSNREGICLFDLDCQTHQRSSSTCCELKGRLMLVHIQLPRLQRWLRLIGGLIQFRFGSIWLRIPSLQLTWRLLLENMLIFPSPRHKDWSFSWQTQGLDCGCRGHSNQACYLRTYRCHRRYGTNHWQPWLACGGVLCMQFEAG